MPDVLPAAQRPRPENDTNLSYAGTPARLS